MLAAEKRKRLQLRAFCAMKRAVVIFVSDENDSSSKSVDSSGRRHRHLQREATHRFASASIVGSVDGDASRCRVNGTASPQSAAHSATSVAFLRSRWCVQASGPRCGGSATCSQYNVDGCCSALAGGRYVEFTKKAVEQKMQPPTPESRREGAKAATAKRRAASSHRSARPASRTPLERIATELVVQARASRSIPAVFPEGVSVALRMADFRRRKEARVRDGLRRYGRRPRPSTAQRCATGGGHRHTVRRRPRRFNRRTTRCLPNRATVVQPDWLCRRCAVEGTARRI